MQIRTTIAAGAVVLLAAGGTALIPLVASAHTEAPAAKTHTIKFTALQQKMVTFSSSTGAAAENDVNAKGTVIGFDILYFTFNAKTGAGTVTVAFTTNGGMLYGTAAATESPVTRGKITGGTGAFKGAKGALTATSLNAAGTKTAVVITYTT
jgi:hypothetical protein